MKTPFIVCLLVGAQQGVPPPAPPGGDASAQKMLELFAKVELKLREIDVLLFDASAVGSSRVDLQACKLEYSIVSPK